MHEKGTSRSDGTVVFGQLLGMCDHVTFQLGEWGGHVTSYDYIIMTSSLFLQGRMATVPTSMCPMAR